VGGVDRENGALTTSDPPLGAEVQALRNKAEELPDDVRALAALVTGQRGGVGRGGGAEGWGSGVGFRGQETSANLTSCRSR